jgi:hypothetical protein
LVGVVVQRLPSAPFVLLPGSAVAIWNQPSRSPAQVLGPVHDEPRQDQVQDRLGIRLEDVLQRRQVVEVLVLRHERQELADHRLLPERVDEAREREVDLVDLAFEELLDRRAGDRRAHADQLRLTLAAVPAVRQLVVEVSGVRHELGTAGRQPAEAAKIQEVLGSLCFADFSVVTRSDRTFTLKLAQRDAGRGQELRSALGERIGSISSFQVKEQPKPTPELAP